MELALENQLTIEAFISQGDLSEIFPPFHHKFLDDDWLLLAELRRMLQPLYRRTVEMRGWNRNGNPGSIWEILTGLEYLICESDEWATFIDRYTQIPSPLQDQEAMRQAQVVQQINLHMQQRPGAQRQQAAQPVVQVPYADMFPQPMQSGPQPIPNQPIPSPRPVQHPHPPKKPQPTQTQPVQNPRSTQIPQPTQPPQPIQVPHVIQAPQTPRLSQLRQRTIGTRTSSPPLETRFHALRSESQSFLSVSVRAGWEKLIELHTMLRKSFLYTSAIILHPGIRLDFFERIWTGEEVLAWAPEAREGLRRLWEVSYRQTEPPMQIVQQIPKEDFHDFVFARAEHLDEVDRYLRLDLSNFKSTQDAVEWWLSRRQSFPTLSQLALDIFSIPATSSDFQTASSCAKSCLADRIPSPTTLEYRQCLKDWSQRGVISLGSVPVGSSMFFKVEPVD